MIMEVSCRSLIFLLDITSFLFFLLLQALFPDLQVVIHVLCGADEDGGSLVDGGWLDVKDGFGSTAGLPSCLLYDVGHRTALVEETELEE